MKHVLCVRMFGVSFIAIGLLLLVKNSPWMRLAIEEVMTTQDIAGRPVGGAMLLDNLGSVFWLSIPGAIPLIVGVGLLRRRGWARQLVLAWAAISVSWLILTLCVGTLSSFSDICLKAIGVIWYVVALFYFLRPAVKAQFVKTAASNQ